jgi:hypothetical protein
VLCNEHGHLVYCTNLPVARESMKDPTTFCIVCRCIAAEGPRDWEKELAPHDVAAVWQRRGAEHAILFPEGRSLPFSPRGKVFRLSR